MPILCTLIATPTAALARMPRSGSGGSSGSGGAGIGGSGSTTAPSPPTTALSTTAPSPPTTAPPTTAPSTTAPPTPTPATTTPATTIPGVIRLAGVVNASGHGISLTVAASGTQGRPLTISGGAPTSDSGALISIEWVRAGRADWTQVATATIAADGSFSVQWTPSANGQVELRALLAPAGSDATDSSGSAGLSRSAGGSASAAADEIGTSAVTIPIFRNAVATLYGPGFWGHHTACGQRLTRTTLGVASRTLKCGTEVAVRYKGRELTVPVIDRGPFANRASWDLTMATAKALGISQTATIGTLASARVPTFAATASR